MVWSYVFSFLFLDAQFVWLGLVGSVLIAGGAVMVSLKRKKPEEVSPTEGPSGPSLPENIEHRSGFSIMLPLGRLAQVEERQGLGKLKSVAEESGETSWLLTATRPVGEMSSAQNGRVAFEVCEGSAVDMRRQESFRETAAEKLGKCESEAEERTSRPSVTSGASMTCAHHNDERKPSDVEQGCDRSKVSTEEDLPLKSK